MIWMVGRKEVTKIHIIINAREQMLMVENWVASREMNQTLLNSNENIQKYNTRS